MDDSLSESDGEEFTTELGDEPQGTGEQTYRSLGKSLVATVSLCMLCYARNQQSNILQMITGYYAYADNTTKRMVEVLHRMGLTVVYNTVRLAINANAEAIRGKIKQMAWEQRFFVSYDNLIFYEHRPDQRMTNKGHCHEKTGSFFHTTNTQSFHDKW